MNDIAKRLNTYIESHDTDPPEISNGFKELEQFLRTLPLADNDTVFNLCCRALHTNTKHFLMDCNTAHV